MYMMPLFQSPVVIEFVKKVTFSFMLARTEWHCLYSLRRILIHCTFIILL